MRFRSGTLERSVKRFGRFPRFNKFQRVGHTWKYVTLEDTAMDESGAKSDVSIIDADDWALAGTATGVKNVSLDLACGVTWTPDVSGLGTTFDSWSLKSGLFQLDVDDASGSVDTYFASTRALWWGATFRNTKNNANVATSQPTDPRSWNFRVRARARFLKFDEEIRLLTHFQSDVSAVISDARMWIFGRVSWETP